MPIEDEYKHRFHVVDKGDFVFLRKLYADRIIDWDPNQYLDALDRESLWDREKYEFFYQLLTRLQKPFGERFPADYCAENLLTDEESAELMARWFKVVEALPRGADTTRDWLRLHFLHWWLHCGAYNQFCESTDPKAKKSKINPYSTAARPFIRPTRMIMGYGRKQPYKEGFSELSAHQELSWDYTKNKTKRLSEWKERIKKRSTEPPSKYYAPYKFIRPISPFIILKKGLNLEDLTYEQKAELKKCLPDMKKGAEFYQEYVLIGRRGDNCYSHNDLIFESTGWLKKAPYKIFWDVLIDFDFMQTELSLRSIELRSDEDFHKEITRFEKMLLTLFTIPKDKDVALPQRRVNAEQMAKLRVMAERGWLGDCKSVESINGKLDVQTISQADLVLFWEARCSWGNKEKKFFLEKDGIHNEAYRLHPLFKHPLHQERAVRYIEEEKKKFTEFYVDTCEAIKYFCAGIFPQPRKQDLPKYESELIEDFSVENKFICQNTYSKATAKANRAAKK